MPVSDPRARGVWQQLIDSIASHSTALEKYHQILSDPPDPETITPVDASLRYEAWVRAYLQDVGTDYGIEIHGDLDKEVSNKQRGDVRAMYEGEEVIIEVEKDLKLFFQHDHRTEGERGWNDVGKIDMVFAAHGNRDKANEMSLPVIIANQDAPDGTDGFDEWYGKARARDKVFNDLPEEYIHLLSNYLTVILTVDFPSKNEMENSTHEGEKESARQNTNKELIINSFAMDVLLSHVRSFLPEPENTDKVIEMIQAFDTHDELVDRIFDSVVHAPVENEDVFGECECGELWYEICRDTRAQEPQRLNFENMSEGQIAMQLTGEQNSKLSEGVIQDEVAVACCHGCGIVTRFYRTLC